MQMKWHKFMTKPPGGGQRIPGEAGVVSHPRCSSSKLKQIGFYGIVLPDMCSERVFSVAIFRQAG